MKVTEVRVEIKTGLPNYSSRTTSVVVVADEDESLDIVQTVRGANENIQAAWSGEKKPAPVAPVVVIGKNGKEVVKPTKSKDGILD